MTQVARTQVRANITSHGLHVGSRSRRRAIVDDLVTREKGQSVVILGKLLDSGKDVLEVDVVVRLLGLGAVEGVLGGVDIQHQVDAGLGQDLHALIVILGVVDRVHADGIESEILELLQVALASVGIGDGICQLGRAAGLVVDAADVESLVALEERVATHGDGSDAVASLDGGGNSQHGGRAESESSS